MLNTEEKNPRSKDLDILSTEQILRLMNEEDLAVIEAVRPAIPTIAMAVNEAIKVIRDSGKIFYAGAGTSGRLGVLDASEMPPTFGVPADLFNSIIAGGDPAIRNSIEGAEDDESAGRSAASAVTDKDLVLGISASGTTPFVLSCLSAAKDKGARCWLLTCNDIEVSSQNLNIPNLNIEIQDPKSKIQNLRLDGIIKIITGPEIIAGSTRLKAGTATKLALNMFSTATMIRLGNVYKRLMVNVTPSNKKLIERAENIIMELTGCNKDEASGYLRLSQMRPKVAIVMKAKNVSVKEAEELLAKASGSLRNILE